MSLHNLEHQKKDQYSKKMYVATAKSQHVHGDLNKKVNPGPKTIAA